MLSFQRLDVYQRSIQFLAFASELVEELPRGNSERSDQLIRAAESVPRNIAEGAGRWSRLDMSTRLRVVKRWSPPLPWTYSRSDGSSSSLGTSVGSSS